ncbi:MAG: hypothetical protein HYZ79_09070, partial [Candidatus Melainabacteria bacterium]|nr:hypothetical protein [Candidatus Melainabacteria bacterium]
MEKELLLNKVKFPVLILSSKAGFGNYSVGCALKDQLSKYGRVYHKPIEEIISINLNRVNFQRYKLI